MELKELVARLKVKDELAQADKALDKNILKEKEKAQSEKLKTFMKKVKTHPLRYNKDIIIVEGSFAFTANQNKELLNGNDVLSISDKTQIIITPYAKGTYTDKFFKILSQTKARLYKLDFYGNPQWSFYGEEALYPHVLQAQIMFLNEKYDNIRASLIRVLVNTKLKNQGCKKTVPEYKGKNIKGYINIAQGVEGSCADRYFDEFKKKYDIAEIFKERSGKNAGDIINTLFNLGYGILAHHIRFKIYEAGLSASIGFYHRLYRNNDSLVWDLIEPYRNIIDNTLTENINKITTESFIWEKTGQKRHLMLKFAPHFTGDKSVTEEDEYGYPALPEYKKWVAIFNNGMPDDVGDGFLKKYRICLKEVMQKENKDMNTEDIKRALGE